MMPTPLPVHVDAAIIEDVASIRRAVLGDPGIKSPGLIDRVTSLEGTIRRMVLVMPLSLFLGAAGGGLISKWVGL